MKIIVDAFGGDNAPLEILKACAEAVTDFDIDILLTGDQDEIRRVAKENNISLNRMEIIHAPSVITMEDEPTEITKGKSDSSMAEGCRQLVAGNGDAFISAGNSGALVVFATLLVKRIKGIKRVAFAPIMPKSKGHFMLLDAGANNECRPEMLQQFGVMGSIYMEKVMHLHNPRVGLANIGGEENKGTQVQVDAYQMLKASKLNFVGNVEGRALPVDAADVVVADGFTGNMILKVYEGVAMVLMSKIKGIFTKSTKNKLAASVVLKDMKELKKMFDYTEVGGAPILGASKPVFKAHGSADARTFKSAIRLTKQYVESNVVGLIADSISEYQTKENS